MVNHLRFRHRRTTTARSYNQRLIKIDIISKSTNLFLSENLSYSKKVKTILRSTNKRFTTGYSRKPRYMIRISITS